MNKPHILCVAIAALAVLAGAGQIVQPAAAQNQVEAATNDSRLSVELNEGQLVRLDRPVNSVFIANSDVADVSVKSPRLVYLFGKRPGETTLYAVDENEQVIANYRVVVSHNMSRLNTALARLFPEERVVATSIDTGIVLSGMVESPTEAENARRLAQRFIGKKEEIINQLQVMAPNQVNLRVRIAEVSRTVVRQFGFNWEAAFQGSSFTLGIATGNPVTLGSLFNGNSTISPPVPFPGLANDPFITRTGGTQSVFGGGSIGQFDINGLIDLLQTDQLVTILAEPNLTALSGETASFLAGGEFPIPVGVGDDQIAIEFKEFGVSLSFTPTMLSGNRISMRVRPEVSQLTNNGAIIAQNIQIPGLTTRRAETTVELASGQSFAIAGLFLDNSLQDLDAVPGLNDIPILGDLFRSDRFERRETELMIIVTPYVVRPVDTRIPAPTDYYSKRPASKDAMAATAQKSSSPRTIPLNGGTPTASRVGESTGFIVE